jgi:hypothetical protein
VIGRALSAGARIPHYTGGSPSVGDPFYDQLIYLFLTQGTTSPPGGTMLFDEISDSDATVGELPFVPGSLFVDTADKPFGSASLQFPGNVVSNNFMSFSPPGPRHNVHPAVEAVCWDGWVNPSSLASISCLTGDDTLFGSVAWNWYLLLGTTGVVNLQTSIALTNNTTPVGADSLLSISLLPLDTWSHVAIDSDGLGNVHMYINGVKESSMVCSATFLSQDIIAMYLGAQNKWVGGFDRVYTGRMKCMRLTGCQRYGGAASFTPPASIAEYGPLA